MALSVVRGDGKRLDYIPRGPTNTSADLFANGLELIDPTPDSAALPAADGGATQAVGANVVFLLYTLQMAGSTTRWPIPSSVHVNQAGVLQYASANLVGQRDNYVSNGLSGGVAGVATLTIATPTILCSIDSTSEAFTSETPLAGATPVAIGESAVVRKIITLPAGFSPAVQLVEALDTGMVFVSLSSLTYDSALTTSLSAGWPQTFTSTTSTRLTLALGNVTNTACTAANITLVYTVSIRASSSQANAQLNARSSWSWATASNVGAASATASCSSVFVIYRPLLAVTKAANTTTVDADDTLRYTITVRHAATSFTDAFNVTITDTPHAAGKLIAGSVNITYSGAGSNAQLPAFVMRSGNATGDSSLQFVASSMALVGSGTTTIQYLVRINVTLAAATAIVNTARVTYQSLPPTSSAFARNHWLALPAVTATATITSRAPRLTLALRSSSDAYTGSTKLVSGNADLAVAEVAVFQLTAEFPEGTSFATVQITLPSGFGYIASGIESIGARLQPSVSSPTLRLLSSNKVLEWDFVAAINTPDNVVSALDRIIFNVTLVVENQPTVTVHGAIQSLVAQVTQYSSSRTTFNVDIVEPLMQWTLTPDRTLVDATSSVRFTLRGTCLAAGTTAYNASIVRLLVPDTLLLNASSLQTAAAGTRSGWTFIVPRSMSLSSAGVLAADWPLLRSGDAVELYFTAKLTQAALLGSVLSVSATAQWASQPVPLPNNNTVSAVIAARHVRWYSAAMSTQLTVPPASLTKLIHATSLVDTDTIGVYLTSAASTITTMPAVAIGESVTYRITVTLPACTAAPLVVHDQLPLLNSVMSVVSASIVGSTGTFEPPITPGKAGVFFDRNGDSFNDQVDWTLGSSSRALLVLTSNATITFELTAIVIDSDRNTAANLAAVAPAQQQQLSDWLLTNQVSVASSVSASASALLVEPLVRVDYDVISTINANALLAVGSSVQYRLTIAHASNSSSTAHSLVVDIVSPSIARFVSLGAQSGTCQGVAIDIERLTTMTRLRLPSLPLTTTTGTSDGRMRSSGYPQPLEAQSSCTIVLSMRIIRALVPSRNPSATVSSAFVSYDSMPSYIEHQTRRRTAYDACAFAGSVNGTVPCGAHQSWNATLSRCMCDAGFVGDALLCGVERAVRVMLNQTGTTEAQIDPELQESALSVSVISVSDKNNLRLYQSSSGGIGSDARIGAPLNTHNTSAPWSVSNVNGLFFIWLPFGVKPDRYTVQLSYTTLPTVSGSTTTIVTVLIDTYYPCPDLDDLSVTEFGFTKAPNLGRAFLEWSQETFTLDVRIEAAYERDQAVVLVDTVDFDSYHGDLRVRANNSCSARPAFPSSIALRTLFQSAPTATSNEALDGTYFAYPDTSSTGWSVSAKDCATVYYERSFTLSELTQCNGIETTTTTDPRTGQTTLAYTGQFFVHTLQPGDEFTYRDAAGFAKFMQIFPFELRFNANFDAVVQAIPSDRIHVVVREMRIEQQADLYMVLETQVYGTGLVNPAAPTLASDTARTLQPDATEASSAPCLSNQPGDLCVQRWTYRRAEWNEVGDTGVYQFRWSLQSNTDDELEVPILIRMRVNALQVRVGRLGDLQLSLFNRQAAARAGDTSQQKPFSYLWDANDRMFLRGEVMLNAADVPQYRVELVHLLVCYRPTDDYEITLDKGGCNDPMVRPEHRFSLVSSMAVEPSTDFRTGLFPVDNGRSSVAFGAAWQAFPLTEQSRVYTIHARALLLPPTGSTTNRNRRAVEVLYEPDDRNPGAAGRFLTARATQADTQAGDAGDSPYKAALLSTVGIGLLSVCCIVGLMLLRSRNGTTTRQTSGAA